MENSTLTPLPENVYPYAVRASLYLGNNIELDFSGDDLRLPFFGNISVRLVKEPATPREQALFIKRVTVDLEAFSSACEAERAGNLLALSLLWVAASKRVTIAFEKWTGGYPFAIRDRTRSDGVSVRAEGRIYRPVKPEEFSSRLMMDSGVVAHAGPRAVTMGLIRRGLIGLDPIFLPAFGL